MGTPAPVAPTAHLVVGGLYRHVRNPMYVAVVGAVVGQALLLGQFGLLVYAALLQVTFIAFVRGYEEPTLRRQFGPEYDAYRRGGSGLVAASTAGTTPARDELSSSSSPGSSRRSRCSRVRAATCSAGSARPRSGV